MYLLCTLKIYNAMYYTVYMYHSILWYKKVFYIIISITYSYDYTHSECIMYVYSKSLFLLGKLLLNFS